MEVKGIIGRTITDIFVWTKLEFGGLDKGEVCIELDHSITIDIPWDFEPENLEKQPRKGSVRLFSDLKDIPMHYVNAEGKTIQEIVDTQKERQSSVLGRIKNSLGLGGGIPKAYKTHRTDYRENKLKYLKNQKIVDFLMFEDSDSVGFLELENGYIITETMFSPHGTGMAGLTYFQDITHFEERCGKDYKRFKEQ